MLSPAACRAATAAGLQCCIACGVSAALALPPPARGGPVRDGGLAPSALAARDGSGAAPVPPLAERDDAGVGQPPVARQPPVTGFGSFALFEPSEPAAGEPWLSPLGRTAQYPGAEPLGGGRGLWLGVSGGIASSPGERRRVFGLLELGVGLDELVGGRMPSFAETEVEASFWPEAAGPGEADRVEALTETPRAPLRRSLEASGGDAFPSPPSGSSASAQRVSAPPRRAACPDARSCDPAVMAQLARAAVTEALRVRGGGAELRRLDGMAARSRAAASLPEIRLGAGTSRDESLRLTPTAADPGRFTRDGGRDLWLEARLTWRLDSAIFARDEIAIMRLRAQQRDEASRLTEDVLEALVNWQRARGVLASDEALPDERDAAAVRQFGAVARLDVLTDGWFSETLARSRAAGAGVAGP
jgi:hypothetical protein